MRETIRTPQAPAPIGPYVQAVRVPGLLFVSGQIAIDPATGLLSGGDAAAQARRALENLKAIVEAGGSSMARVVRTTLYLRDMGDFTSVNEAYASFFGAEPPARSTIQAAALPKGAAVEIDAIALA